MSALAHKYAAGLRELTKGLGREAAESAVRNFVGLLASRGRLALGPAVALAYERLLSEESGVAAVRLTTAEALTEKEAAAVASDLKKALGREVALEREVDAGLIGGAILRYDDVLVDDSLKGRLQRLQGHLTSDR